MQKIITVEEAISKIKDNAVVMVGGFMAGGSPKQLLDALANSPITGLTLICNDTAFPDKGVGQ
jgi:acetate CoA/acetoacetate CoA-transferase alpha subunit